MRDDHLRVCLGAEGAGLKEGLLVPDAAFINVMAGINIINCVDYEAQALPELVIEDMLSLLGHEQLMRVDIQCIVNILSDIASRLGLRLADIVLSEQEMSVQVRNLDVVIVSNSDSSLIRAANTHESEGLDELATESACSDHKSLKLS